MKNKRFILLFSKTGVLLAICIYFCYIIPRNTKAAHTDREQAITAYPDLPHLPQFPVSAFWLTKPCYILSLYHYSTGKEGLV